MNQRMWKSLLKKAHAGDADAQCDVGTYYEDGFIDRNGKRILSKDPAKAVHWYRLSAEQGNISAQNQLGVCLSTGKGVRRDVKKAVAWTKQALSKGDPIAAHNLATIYRDLSQYDKAFELYNRAVTLGFIDSLLEVGLSLYYGIGTKRSQEAARKCFQKIIKAKSDEVAEATREDAYYMLGIASLESRVIKKSISKARLYFELANKDDDHRAAQLLLWMTGRSRVN